jgi:hypothetical protein
MRFATSDGPISSGQIRGGETNVRRREILGVRSLDQREIVDRSPTAEQELAESDSAGDCARHAGTRSQNPTF